MVFGRSHFARSIRRLVPLTVLAFGAAPILLAGPPTDDASSVTTARPQAVIPPLDPEFLDRAPAVTQIEPEPQAVSLIKLPRSAEPLAWNRKELALKWTYLTLSAIDAHQTANFPPGFRESNPLLAGWAGDRPDTMEAALFKAAGTYGLIHLTNRYAKTRRGRRRALYLLIGLQLVTVVHNETHTGGIVF